MQFSRTSLVVAAMLSLAGAAHAQSTPLQFSFGFDALDGHYNSGTNVFSASAAAGLTQIDSVGNVLRNATPGGTAVFSTGFYAGANPADFTLSMNISDISGTVASGFGTFTITDADNDIITGNIAGDRFVGDGFRQNGNFVRFFGDLQNVRFFGRDGAGAPNADSTFDGPNGGSVNFADLPPIFTGALVQLYIFTGGGSFSSGNWGYVPGDSNRPPIPVNLTAQLIPAPGAAALLGLGGVMVGRRRRR